MSKFDVDEVSGCWVWNAGGTTDGYGKIRGAAKYRFERAHRVAYELFVGPIPEGLTIDHLCRNRGCVNPEHLEPVTSRENILRGENHVARFAARTHCDHGHPFSEENTYFHPAQGRRCRACYREQRRLKREAAKQAKAA